MTDEIKEKAFMLAAGVCLPGTPTDDIIAKAREIEAYLREGEGEEVDAVKLAQAMAQSGVDALNQDYVKYRDAPAQTVALDEAEERDGD